MSDKYITFKKFNDEELAKDFASLLTEHGIQSQIEKDSYDFDASYANHPLNTDFRVNLLQSDFAKANTILDDFFTNRLQFVPDDYYLYSFTNEELREILAKPDEWGPLDNVLAKKLLHDRGEQITPERLAAYKLSRKIELNKPEKTDQFSILAGYFCALLFGIYGIFMGLMMVTTKKPLPDGQIVYANSPSQRFHGQIIIGISIANILLWAWGIKLAIFS